MKHHVEPLTAGSDQRIPATSSGVGAVAFLTAQHREIEALCDQLSEAGPGHGRAKLMARVVHLAEGHLAIEEEVFYPAAKSVGKAMVLKCLEEHGMIKAVNAKLHAIGDDDDTLVAKVAVLKDTLRRHFKEEEKHFFPMVKEALDDKRMAALGASLEQAWERFNSQPFAVKLPQKRAAATKRSSTGGRSAKVTSGSKPLGDRPTQNKGKATLTSQARVAAGVIIRRRAT